MASVTRADVLITAEELKTKLDDPSLRIFDATVIFGTEVSSHDRYRDGHIPGAAFLDHAAVSAADAPYQFTVPEQAELEERLGAMGISNDSEVVVYSTEMIAWATRVWWLLRYAGHTNVRVLDGGLLAWQQAGGHLEPGEVKYPVATFSASLQPGMFVGLQQVEDSLGQEDVLTINSLPQQVYDQGHIPGSLNHSCMDLMNDGAYLLPTEQLVEKLAGETDKQVVTYCGGGIAATVNAVAHLLAGNDRVAVYDGSMSEWRGEGKPIESSEQSDNN